MFSSLFNALIQAFSRCSAGLATLSLIFTSSLAQAAMITFADFEHAGSDAIDYIVTIEDDSEAGVSSGSFRITYQVDPSSESTTAKLTGFFLDFGDSFSLEDGPYDSSNLGLSNESVSSCGQGFNTLSVNGKGCNTNLTLGALAGEYKKHQWDVAIAWKKNDLSDGEAKSFEISALNLALEDIAAIALRGQATTGPGGSAKDFQRAPSVVPLPASSWLMLSGLAVVIISKRSQRKAKV